MPLALVEVGAIGEKEGDGGDRKERDGAGVGGDHDRAREREARVRGAHDEVHAKHVPDRPRLERALRERDREADRDHRQETAEQRGGHHRNPDVRPDLLGSRRDRVDDQQPQASRERELGQVEDQLDRRQAAVEQKRQPGADQDGGHQVPGAGEDEAEDERDVAQRERVGAAAKVQVHDGALGDQERRREDPPAQVRRGEGRKSPGKAEVERRRRSDEHQVQPPDWIGCAQGALRIPRRPHLSGSP